MNQTNLKLMQRREKNFIKDNDFSIKNYSYYTTDEGIIKSVL